MAEPTRYATADADGTVNREIKPWLPSYPQELQKAIEQGASAEEKLKHPLPAKFNVGTSVVYQNKECGQFIL